MRNFAEQQALDEVLGQRLLHTQFQPIVEPKSQRILGFEALMRGPQSHPLHSPLALLSAAKLTHREFQLEWLAMELAIEAFTRLNQHPRVSLFLNISPHVLVMCHQGRGSLQELLSRFGLSNRQLVFELSEMHRVEELDALKAAVDEMRQQGFRFALDDYGTGYSNAQLWMALRPDYVKIDRYFCNQIHLDKGKRAHAQSLMQMAKLTSTSVIFEGIETNEELLELLRCGLVLAQGYLFARPQSQPCDAPYWPPIGHTTDEEDQLTHSLLQSCLPLASNLKAEEAAKHFEQNPELEAVAVVDKQGAALGLLTRLRLLELFSKTFGRELNGKRRLHELADRTVPMVAATTPIGRLSQEISDLDDGNWQFIIVEGSRYLGLGSVRDLLKQVTEQKLHHARYANPLTQLPGNVPIFEKIDALLAAKRAFHVAYFDLNHFKPYNDSYGYSQGDEVITMVATLLRQYCDHSGNFVGHLGGDDFLVVFTSSNWQLCCQRVVEAFDARIRAAYSSDDIAAGGIRGVSREGKPQFFPILSLAVGVASPDPMSCHNHHDVAELATNAKHTAKQLEQGGVFVSRRRHPQRNRRTHQSVA